MFRALVLEKENDGQAVATIKELDVGDLPPSDVTVAVD